MDLKDKNPCAECGGKCCIACSKGKSFSSWRDPDKGGCVNYGERGLGCKIYPFMRTDENVYINDICEFVKELTRANKKPELTVEEIKEIPFLNKCWETLAGSFPGAAKIQKINITYIPSQVEKYLLHI